MIVQIHPTASWQIGGALALMWGKPTDWRTAPLESEGDQKKAPEVIKLLEQITSTYKINRILSPNVSRFNSVFLSDGSQYPWKLTLRGTACKLHRGLYGDGFEVHPSDVGIIAPADCAVVVATTPNGRVFMLHAGRDSLVDRQKIMSGIESKQFESIIFAAWHEMCRVSKENALQSKWFVLPSISHGDHFQHNWEDSVRGDANKLMVSYLTKRYDNAVKGNLESGMINIPAIIASQLVQYCGVNPENIFVDTRCTYTERDACNQFVWHSNARAVRTGGDPRARNIVAVINTGH